VGLFSVCVCLVWVFGWCVVCGGAVYGCGCVVSVFFVLDAVGFGSFVFVLGLSFWYWGFLGEWFLFWFWLFWFSGVVWGLGCFF